MYVSHVSAETHFQISSTVASGFLCIYEQFKDAKIYRELHSSSYSVHVFLKYHCNDYANYFFLRFQIYNIMWNTARKIFHLLNIIMFRTSAILIDSSLFWSSYHYRFFFFFLRIWHVLLLSTSSCIIVLFLFKILSYFIVPLTHSLAAIEFAETRFSILFHSVVH